MAKKVESGSLGNFGKWKVEKTLKEHRCYLVSSEDGSGVVKIKKEMCEPVSKEVAILKGLDHPNIATLLDYDLNADIPYMVTRYVSHSELSDKYAKCCDIGNLEQEFLENLTREERLSLFVQAVNTMIYLQRNDIRLHGGNYVLSDDHTLVFIDFEYASITDKVHSLPYSLRIHNHFQHLVLARNGMHGDKLKAWAVEEKTEFFRDFIHKLDLSDTDPSFHNIIMQLSMFFWHLMEGEQDRLNFPTGPLETPLNKCKARS